MLRPSLLKILRAYRRRCFTSSRRLLYSVHSSCAGFPLQVCSQLCSLLVACACADINAGIVPDIVVIAIAVLGIVNFLVLEPFTVASFISHLIGAVCISVPMLLISLIVRGAFGGGDIKLMAAAGLYLGWQLTLAGAFIGMFVSGFYGIYLLVFNSENCCYSCLLVYKVSIYCFSCFNLSSS